MAPYYEAKFRTSQAKDTEKILSFGEDFFCFVYTPFLSFVGQSVTITELPILALPFFGLGSLDQALLACQTQVYGPT